VALIAGSLALPRDAWAQLPPLPGNLVVTITSPTSGSTVSGTITVSASVSPLGVLVGGVYSAKYQSYYGLYDFNHATFGRLH